MWDAEMKRLVYVYLWRHKQNEIFHHVVELKSVHHQIYYKKYKIGMPKLNRTIGKAVNPEVSVFRTTAVFVYVEQKIIDFALC